MTLALSRPRPAIASRQAAALAAILVLIAVGGLRIAATWPVFSHTTDETYHVSRAMVWHETGAYPFPHHPPLAPIAIGLGPRLAGIEAPDLPPDTPDLKRAIGNATLYDAGAGDYHRRLSLARAGTLVFYLVVCATVAAWGWRRIGPTAAVVATGLVSSLPPVLAHAGLATTDAAAMATIPLALLAFLDWLERPGAGRTAWLGIAGGLALAAKYSALVFLPVAGLAILAVRAVALGGLPVAPRRLAALPAALALALGVVWATYGFSVTPIAPPASADPRAWLADGPVVSPDAWLPVPGWSYWRGIKDVAAQNRAGHAPYFLGETGDDEGDWRFFPVMLAVKLPLGFLGLVAIGAGVAVARVRRSRDRSVAMPLAAAGAIVLAVLPSDINIGLRHILPVLPLLALVAGAGAAALIGARHARPAAIGLAVVLLAAHAVEGARAHPDYLAHFNALAGGQPEAITVDSDLDWGQDLDRLSSALEARGVDRVNLGYTGTADPARHGLPPITPLDSTRPPAGWVAVSLHRLMTDPDLAWLRAMEPVATVGRSIRLYHLDPGPEAGPGDESPVRLGAAAPAG
ncbi:MAG: phospholipid carrier-dependent glycosyltransferase [Azospirillaceae bacterium]